MICENLQQLLIQIIIFAIINIKLALALNKRIITAATSFWTGWLFLILGTISFQNNGLINKMGSLELYYISRLHIGAFLGFSLGSMILSIKKTSSKSKINLTRLHEKSIILSEVISKRFLNILLIIGLIFFAQRISQVGLSANIFSELRSVYNKRSFNFFSWLGTHISVIVYFFIIVQGIKDNFDGMNLKKLFKIILYASPLFLANATRTFLIFPLIHYFSSFLLMRAYCSKKLIIINKRELKKIVLGFGTMLLIFSTIGFFRGGYGEKLNLYLTIVGWPVSTSGALDSWLTDSIYNAGETNGFLNFGWFANFSDRLGLIDYSKEKEVLISTLFEFLKNNNSAAVIPRSIIPDIIYDFGINSVLTTMLILSFISQIITINFTGKSIPKHVLSGLFFVGSFMTIQNTYFSPGFISLLFWAFFFNFLLTKGFIKTKIKNV
ncbi:O-antigen polymerase [Pseudotamlana carrageenivorans]|uniref:Oligosaccharide repeat unit polymerase n=1 Tax=Pseudotamlana carrageenivorans TaxID=2069432 RepID=A0A2I7SIX5_9FLAO|nr:O-antigen polymerase [Tamlana carrageenivorans]AUS05838.1 hypothetical protein C1A40_10360 [Tamlana carrageenivorans]